MMRHRFDRHLASLRSGGDVRNIRWRDRTPLPCAVGPSQNRCDPSPAPSPR